MKEIILKFGLGFLTMMSLSILAIGQGMPDSTFNTLLRTENGGWVGGDATYSILLPDGRTLWLFGDSFIGVVEEDSSLAPGAHMIRNCAVIQEDTIMTAIYNGTFENPLDFVETLTPDSTWYWPEHGIVENDTLKIIFSEFGTNDGAPGWNFEYREAWVIRLSFPELDYIDQIKLPYYQENGVMYGDRIMTIGNYNYIYGRKEENPQYHLPLVHLARVEVGNLLSPWEFYDGNYWVDSPEQSSKLTDHNVSQQFGVFQHMDKFVMITQEIWLGSKIYSLVANQPEGPWSNVTVIYDTPRPFPDQLTYNAYPHPQFNENNELLVSYNSNGDFWEIFNNIELYRPNFFRIPYTSIHPSFTPTVISNEKDIHRDIICYPNPASENIIFKSLVDNKALPTIRIYDILGNEVMIIPEQLDDEIEINISVLSPGLYIYNINDIKGKFFRK